jgi:hypothetical protein
LYLQIPPLQSRPGTATSTAGVLTHSKTAVLLTSSTLPHSLSKSAAAAAAHNSAVTCKLQLPRPSTAAVAGASTTAAAGTTITAAAAAATAANTAGGNGTVQQRAVQHADIIRAAGSTTAAGGVHSSDAAVTAVVRQGVARGVHSTAAHTVQVLSAAQQLKGALYDVTRHAAVSATAAINIDDLRGALALRAVNAELAAAAAETAGTGSYTNRNGTIRFVPALHDDMLLV